MKSNAQLTGIFVCLVASVLAAPIHTLAGRQETGQRAGEVSRVIPSVAIARGAESLNASEKTIVHWQDIVRTQVNGRARVSLDDGSVLNLGSDSALQVSKHDAAAQQTALDLVSGKMRVQAKQLTLPGAKFEVRTSAGVAGVIGTDFYIAYENNVMTVMAFEGTVKVCNLAGACLDLAAGMMTTVHSGDTSGPAQPTHAAQGMVATARSVTSVEASAANAPLGLVAKAVSARVGNADATVGETVFSGDFLSTQDKGSLQVRIGSMSLELEANSSAHIYRAPYGAVVELNSGSAIYDTPGGPQNLVIVASDVRVTPVLTTADLGRVTIDDPCKISVYSQHGQAAVHSGSETKVVEEGKAYQVAAENSVSTTEYRSPEDDDYHSSHMHKHCAAAPVIKAHGPLAPGTSHFLYLAAGTAAILTIIPVSEAFESPKRP